MGGGRKGAREDEGDNNEITRSLRFIMCVSLWHCWSIMFVMGGGMTAGQERGKEHSGRKAKYIFVQLTFTNNASFLG